METTRLTSNTLKLDRPKILVIEDDAGLVEFMHFYFEMCDINCRINGPIFNILPLVEEYQPDLVILDYLMPYVTGAELCRQLKTNAGTSHIPVLVYSAFPDVNRSLIDCGCDAFIAKPFELDDLQVLIEKLIGSVKLCED